MNKTPNPIDKHVGARVKLRRLTVGMSQSKLALQLRLLGLSESMGHHDSEIMDDGRLD
jgi:hypothetical protein